MNAACQPTQNHAAVWGPAPKPVREKTPGNVNMYGTSNSAVHPYAVPKNACGKKPERRY